MFTREFYDCVDNDKCCVVHFLPDLFLQQNIESVCDKKYIWYNTDGLSCHTGKIKEKGLQKAVSKKLYILIN